MHGIYIYRHAVCKNYQKLTSSGSKMEGKYKTIIVTFSYLFVVSHARDQSEYDPWNNTELITDKSLERAYSFSTCNYNLEGGYTCLSCIRALHCYISFAILVDCPLLFPYCRNGRCSRYEGAKCFEEKLSTSTIANTLADESVSITHETPNSNSSLVSNDDKVTSKDGLIIPVQEHIETTRGTLSVEV